MKGIGKLKYISENKDERGIKVLKDQNENERFE
jgi:hypothetical protein